MLLIRLLFNQQNINKDYLISKWEPGYLDSHILFTVWVFFSKKSHEVPVGVMYAMGYTGKQVWAENVHYNLGMTCISFLLSCLGCSTTHDKDAFTDCHLGRWGSV